MCRQTAFNVILFLLFIWIANFSFADIQAISKNDITTQAKYINPQAKIDKLSDARVQIGGRIDLNGEHNIEALLVGGDVTISAKFLKDMLVGAGQLQFQSGDAETAVVVSGKFIMSDNSRIKNSLVVLSGDADIRGEILKDVYIVGGHVNLSAKVNGDVHIAAGKVNVMPSADIKGKLYQAIGGDMQIAPGAHIAHGIHNWVWFDNANQPQEKKVSRLGPLEPFMSFIILVASLGLFLSFYASKTAVNILCQFATRFGASLGVGLLMMTFMPLVFFMLVFMTFGIPLGVTILLLYVLMLIFAHVFSLFALGLGALSLAGINVRQPKRGGLFAALILGIMLFYAASLIPILGQLLFFVMTMLGLGAITLTILNISK